MTIIINGSLGVGKTSTSWHLLKKFDKSVMIDGDYIAAFHPSSIFNQSDINYTYQTITHLIEFHKNNGFPNFIVNYVFENNEMLDLLTNQLKAIGEEVLTIRLVCDEKEHHARILKRNNDQKAWELQRFLELNKIQEQASQEGFIGVKVNTSGKDLEKVVNEILSLISSRRP